MGKAEIAKIIRDARKAKGLTQAEVAKRLGVTPQAVSNFERGKNRISNEILRSMCEIYGISADLVLNNTLVGKFVIREDGTPDFKWEYTKPIRSWVKENQKYSERLYENLKKISPMERIDYLTNEVSQITSSEIEFFLAQKLVERAPEERELLDIIIDALPDDIVLRIEYLRTVLIAGLNVKRGRLPFQKSELSPEDDSVE